jgi:hypothetical protein
LHRQVGRLLAFEDAIDIASGASGGIDAGPNERNNEKSETAVIVLIILGLMGMNMLTPPDWMHGV